MSTIRNPSYVPWNAQSPQKARSELKTPAAGFGLGAKPSGVRLSVTSQSATTGTLGGPDALSGDCDDPDRDHRERREELELAHWHLPGVEGSPVPRHA